jgi:sodium-dependent phosphate cotransporter
LFALRLESLPHTAQTQSKPTGTIRVVLYVCVTLLLFFFALDLMISSFQHLGQNIIQLITKATLNPFTGLFIGLLTTAIIQSSSTTSALVVALVASGSVTLPSAIPMIMGANIGTTITSMIVSLGFINKKKEFRRAVAAGSYHCFFNLLTVIILFPLELSYGFVSTMSANIGNYLMGPSESSDPGAIVTWSVLNPITGYMVKSFPVVALVMISFALLFGSILLFRIVISNLLKAKSPQAFSRFFFLNPFKSFSWGIITTAAIRSSTITTSVVVPIVAKKITSLRKAAPFIMGANVGTTITAFIAALLHTNGSAAISIAIAHLLINVIGVIVFFPIPALRQIPIKMATSLGSLTHQFSIAFFAFILLTFFVVPFALIFFNQR